MSNGGNLPDVPASWNELAKTALQIVTLVAAVASAGISSCNASKVAQVQQHQEANSAKLDDVKAHAEKAAEKAADTDRKVDAVKDKADKIGNKVGASMNE